MLYAGNLATLIPKIKALLDIFLDGIVKRFVYVCLQNWLVRIDKDKQFRI